MVNEWLTKPAGRQFLPASFAAQQVRSRPNTGWKQLKLLFLLDFVAWHVSRERNGGLPAGEGLAIRRMGNAKMENATLVALSRQIALRRNLDVIADNVANITTDGFKRQALNFEEFVMPKARASSFERSDRINTFVADWTTTTDFSNGSIEQSGNPLDVAINGDAFFAVQTPDGERYTRAGNFRIDNTGRLVTADGQPVLGEGGEILFEQNEVGIEIGADGSIASSAGGKGRLRIVAFEDSRALRKAGANLFETDAAPEIATGVQVMQGAIERSNVSGVVEMTRMINATRSYEQITKVIKDQDELRSRAISRLGQLQN